MQLKGLRRATYRPLLGKELGRRLMWDEALRGRKINEIADCARVEAASPMGEVEASQVTNAAFWSLLLSSLCYFSLLQICLDVRTQARAAAQSGGLRWGVVTPGGFWARDWGGLLPLWPQGPPSLALK